MATDILESLLWILARIAVFSAAFSLCWFALVLGVVGQQNRKAAQDLNPNFVVQGKGLRLASMGIMGFIGIYVVVTGRIDRFVDVTVSIALLVAAVAFWWGATSWGSFAFATHSE